MPIVRYVVICQSSVPDPRDENPQRVDRIEINLGSITSSGVVRVVRREIWDDDDPLVTTPALADMQCENIDRRRDT